MRAIEVLLVKCGCPSGKQKGGQARISLLLEIEMAAFFFRRGFTSLDIHFVPHTLNPPHPPHTHTGTHSRSCRLPMLDRLSVITS